MAELNFLSDDDVRLLKRFLTAEKNTLRNTMRDVKGGLSVQSSSPETYVAMTPCGGAIPPRVATRPGSAVCCIFKIDIDGDDHDVKTRESLTPNSILTPVLNPDGSQLRRTVYNLSRLPIFADIVIINRDAYGRWLAQYVDAETTTTNTADPQTTTTPKPLPQACAGSCAWEWQLQDNYGNGVWVEVENNCQAATTTTTEALGACSNGIVYWQCTGNKWVYASDTCVGDDCTAGDPPTSVCSAAEEGSLITTACTRNTGSGGGGDCLCPSPDGVPVYTTQPPPVQGGECKCECPTWCGESEGERTQTGCTSYEEDSVCCRPTTTTTGGPTTTSTTCDCNTTTTAANCDRGCDWIAVPSVGWVLYEGGCPNRCPCPRPSGQAEVCDIQHTPCVISPPVDPSPPEDRCQGTCEWTWVPAMSSLFTGGWYRTSYGCSSNGGVCNCHTPSENGNECGEKRNTACVRPTTTTGTPTTGLPAGPCQSCYPTTTLGPTTTTTVCLGCEYPCNFCEYEASQECNTLFLVKDNCNGPATNGLDCYCPESGYWTSEGNPTGTKVRKRCEPVYPVNTTTTYSPETTTCNPCDDPPNYVTRGCGQCEYVYNSDCNGGQGAWVKQWDGCDGNTGCPCAPPEPVDPQDTGPGSMWHAYQGWNGTYGSPQAAWSNALMNTYCNSANTTTTASGGGTTGGPATTATSCPTTAAPVPYGFCCIYAKGTNGLLDNCQALTQAACDAYNVAGSAYTSTWNQQSPTFQTCADCPAVDENANPTTTLTTGPCPPTTTTTTGGPTTTSTSGGPTTTSTTGDPTGACCYWTKPSPLSTDVVQRCVDHVTETRCAELNDAGTCTNCTSTWTDGGLCATADGCSVATTTSTAAPFGCTCSEIGADLCDDAPPEENPINGTWVGCKYVWNGAWIYQGGMRGDGGECLCPLNGASSPQCFPANPNIGDTHITECCCLPTTTGAPTTTPTPTTTTTAEPLSGACCWVNWVDGSLVCNDITGESGGTEADLRTQCTNTYGGNLTVGQTCAQVDCNTTTTGAPVGGCCCANGSGCTDMTEAECAAAGGYNWSTTGCASKWCGVCTTTTASGGTTTTASGGTTTTASGGTTTTASGGTPTTASGGTTTTLYVNPCPSEQYANKCCFYDGAGRLINCQWGLTEVECANSQIPTVYVEDVCVNFGPIRCDECPEVDPNHPNPLV